MAAESPRKDQVVTEALRSDAANLRRFVRARVRPEEADDVFQVAAMRAVERAHSLADPSRVLPWLYRVFRNVIVDATRSQASKRRLFDEAAPVEEQPTEARGTRALEDACRCSLSQSKQIAASYAAILDLVDVQGLTLGEAAGTLEISVNNATVRLHRARKALKKKMLEHCGVSSSGECLDCRCVYEGCCLV